MPEWTAAADLEAMDQMGVRSAILSITSPGVYFANDADFAVDLARRVDDEAADVVRDHPDRYGLFASLPLPNVDAAMQEMTRALDDLHADGIVRARTSDVIVARRRRRACQQGQVPL